jgi:hypothetical protein
MRGELVMSDSSIDGKPGKALPMKSSGSAQPTKRAASAEERRSTRIAALDGQQAELKRQAQERREERGTKSA